MGMEVILEAPPVGGLPRSAGLAVDSVTLALVTRGQCHTSPMLEADQVTCSPNSSRSLGAEYYGTPYSRFLSALGREWG
jgi:hypothetical protein